MFKEKHTLHRICISNIDQSIVKLFENSLKKTCSHLDSIESLPASVVVKKKTHKEQRTGKETATKRESATEGKTQKMMLGCEKQKNKQQHKNLIMRLKKR